MKRAVSVAICVLLSLLCAGTAMAEQPEPEPWQTAYLAVLREKAAARFTPAEGEEGVESYMLYDVDKNGIPELFLRYGLSTATSQCDVCSFRDGAASVVGRVFAGSSSFYSCPEENGVLLIYRHMYHDKGEKLTLSDGTLVSSPVYEEFVDQTPEKWYQPVDHFWPGAVEVTEFRYDQEFPLLSFREWEKPAPAATETHFPNNDPAFFEKVISQNASVVKVRCDYVGFSLDGENVETVGFRDLRNALTKLVTTESGEWTAGEFHEFVTDLNQDGQLEYVLGHQLDSGMFLSNTYMVILSEQDGTVYAYLDELHTFTGVDSGGVFYRRSEEFGRVSESAYRVFFDAENWFRYSCALKEYQGEQQS